MIVENIKDAKRYFCVNDRFEKAFEILGSENLKFGEKIVVEDGAFWINFAEIDKAASGEKLFEAHRDFLDLHFVIEGEETFGYSDISRLTEEKSYDAEGDFLLLSGKADTLTLKKGDFCVVFPEDAHIPVFAKCSGVLKKAIVKIKL